MNSNQAVSLARSAAGYALALSLSMVFISGGTPNPFDVFGGYWQTRMLSFLFTLAQAIGFVVLSVVGAARPCWTVSALHASSAALVPGCLLYTAAAVFTNGAVVFGLLAAIVLGFATAGALLLWVEVAAFHFEPRTAVGLLAAGTVLAGALSLAFSFLSGTWPVLAALAVMVAVHGVLACPALRALPAGLSSAGRGKGEDASVPMDSVDDTDATLSCNPASPFCLWWGEICEFSRASWRLMALVGAAELAGAMARAMLSDTSALDQVMLQLILFASFVLGASTAMALVRRFPQGLPFERVYLGLFFAEATFFLPAPFFGVAYLGFLMGVENIFVSAVSIYLTLTCVQLAHEHRFDCLFTSGLLLGIASVATGASLLLGAFMSSSFGSAVVSMAAVYAILIIAVGASVVFTRSHQRGAEVADGTEGGGALREEVVPNHPERPVLSFVGGDAGDRVRANPVYRSRYGLSQREIDLLCLALSGRNAASMAAVLAISENTVRYHLKNLYRKFGVHSKQELLEVVERIELEGL